MQVVSDTELKIPEPESPQEKLKVEPHQQITMKPPPMRPPPGMGRGMVRPPMKNRMPIRPPMVRSAPKPVPRKEVKETTKVEVTSDPFGADPFAVTTAVTAPPTKKKPI